MRDYDTKECANCRCDYVVGAYDDGFCSVACRLDYDDQKGCDDKHGGE